MIKAGKYNIVIAEKETNKGWLLADSEGDQVFLPKGLEEDVEEGEELEVFVYFNSNGDMVASLKEAKLQLNEVGYLQVVSNTNFGAFLDWGIPKDLLVPLREQLTPMEEEGWYIVYLYWDDKTNRLAASSKIDNYLQSEVKDLQVGDPVELLISNETDLGVNVIVNHKYKGLVFHNEIFKDLHLGDLERGYVKKIRDDGKLDISLQEQGLISISPNADKILAYLKEHSGEMNFTDKSEPELIYETFEMSKKAFKKALGSLYKERKIIIEKEVIKLIQDS